MKIGILTHKLATNYGGLLQNFALQSVLMDLGHTPQTLNYYTSPKYTLLVKVLSIFSRLIRKLKGEKIALRAWTTEKENRVIAANTEEFIRRYINTTSKFHISQLSLFGREFETLIVGSDQVWSPKYMRPIERFFFSDFQDNRNIVKIAYAASFGGEGWAFNQEETSNCTKLATLFRAISVRENTGVDLCKEYLNCKADHVLDPTLLINPSIYNSIISKHELPPLPAHSLMVYVLDKSDLKCEIIQELSEKLSLNINSVMPRNAFGESGKRGLFDCVFPPVEEWLRGFKEADFVVTDSFHGTVFSIIYQKPFVTILNKERGSDRFTSLLQCLGLNDRLITTKEEAYRLIQIPIDYDVVNNKLDKYRTESIEFLKRNLI